MTCTRVMVATLSVLSPKSLSSFFPQESLVHSAPPPIFQGSTVCVCVLLLLIYSVCILHSGLCTTEPGQSPFWRWDCCFLSGCCHSEGSGLSEQDGCCCMWDDSALGSQWLFSQLSPQSFILSLFSSFFSPLCPHLCWSPE